MMDHRSYSAEFQRKRSALYRGATPSLERKVEDERLQRLMKSVWSPSMMKRDFEKSNDEQQEMMLEEPPRRRAVTSLRKNNMSMTPARRLTLKKKKKPDTNPMVGSKFETKITAMSTGRKKRVKFETEPKRSGSVGGVVPVFGTMGSRSSSTAVGMTPTTSESTRRQRVRKSELLDESKIIRERSISPPPPPPPPLPRDEDNTTTTTTRKAALMMEKAYAMDISNKAEAYRTLKRQHMDSLQTTRGKIKALEDTIEKHKTNEKKLCDINTRLQERLVLFQRQNAENVEIAKERIAELEHELARVTFVAQKGTIDYESMVDEFRDRVWEKRSREIKLHVLRVWGCAVLLNKICIKAKRRRRLKCAKRCLDAWKVHVNDERLARKKNALASDYYAIFIHRRKLFQGWRRYAGLSSAIRKAKNGRVLGKYFESWKSKIKERQTGRIRRCFNAWILYYLRVLRHKNRVFQLEEFMRVSPKPTLY